MTTKSIFFVVPDGFKDRLDLVEVPVVKETKTRFDVKSCRATGWGVQVSKESAFLYPEDAIKDERRKVSDLEHEWRRRKKMLDTLCAELGWGSPDKSEESNG